MKNCFYGERVELSDSFANLCTLHMVKIIQNGLPNNENIEYLQKMKWKQMNQNVNNNMKSVIHCVIFATA